MNKKNSFFLLFLFLVGFNSFSQTPFISFGKSVIGIGSTSGIHPNFRIGIGSNFFSGSLNQDFYLKGIPLQFNGRISSEPYITGRASYFRISYQGSKMRMKTIDSLEKEISELNFEKKSKLEEIYNLERKYGYLDFVLNEYPANQPLPDLLGIDSLINDLPKEIKVSLPDSAEITANNKFLPISQIGGRNEIEQILKLLDFAIMVKQKEVSDLDEILKNLEKEFEMISLNKYEKFFQGINKLDVGLTTLPSVHLSGNAIPIQGLNCGGKFRNWSYGVAAGITITNKAFSNVALDQILNNNANLFNLSSFYQVNTNRFVQATVLEYGAASKNSLFIENFYTGPSMDKFKIVSNSGSGNATNIGGFFTPNFAKNITASGTFGYSYNNEDTSKSNFSNQLLYAASLKYTFPKIKAEFNLKYRNLGTSYNGFSQGIYLSGTSHFESSYQQYFGRRLVAKLSYVHDEFSNMDSLIRFSYLNQSTLDLTYKIGDHSVLYGSGTILDTDISSDEKSSYQIRFGGYADKRFRTLTWQNNLESQYAKMIGLDSNQILSQASLKSGVHFMHWGYAIKGTIQHFEGIGRLVGTNIILQPEFSYRFHNSTMNLAGQYLISDQFGSDIGIVFRWMYEPSEYIQWNVYAQKWLISESQFFVPVDNYSYQPYYINFQLLIFLKNKSI